MKDDNNDNLTSKFRIASAFSVACSVQNAFDVFYDFLKEKWDIVELDLFLTDSDIIFTDTTNYRINGITPSVSLENTYRELEERGILEWVSQSNEIKVIPNIDENLKQIKSIIIIPVSILNTKVAFFLSNSPLLHNEIDISYLNLFEFIANHTFTLITMLKVNKEKQIVSNSLSLLKRQAILASNQIAASEVFVALSKSFESPIKIIKANLEFIQNDVGNTRNRIKILAEQFNCLLNAQKLVHTLVHDIENIPSKHSVYEILETAIEIARPFIIKNGIIIDTKYNEQIVHNINLFGFKIQLLFAIFNTITYSIFTMQDGGNISLTIDKNEETGKVSIIIIDNGVLIDKFRVDTNNDGNFLYDIAGDGHNIFNSVDFEIENTHDNIARRQRQLLGLARHIITKHQGKFSTFCDEGKGTTYKITFPYV